MRDVIQAVVIPEGMGVRWVTTDRPNCSDGSRNQAMVWPHMIDIKVSVSEGQEKDVVLSNALREAYGRCCASVEEHIDPELTGLQYGQYRAHTEWKQIGNESTFSCQISLILEHEKYTAEVLPLEMLQGQ